VLVGAQLCAIVIGCRVELSGIVDESQLAPQADPFAANAG